MLGAPTAVTTSQSRGYARWGLSTRRVSASPGVAGRGRYVWLTIASAPKGLRVGVLEFTVFGKP